MSLLRLVVDNDRPGLPAAFYRPASRPAAVVARIHEETAPIVRAWKAKHQGTKHQGGDVLGEEPAAQVGHEPPGPLHSGASDASVVSTPAECLRRSPHVSFPAHWLLAIPYVVGALGSLAGWFLAYLFGGVR